MRRWRDINRDSWTFTKRRIIGYGGGFGEYQTSYAINQENGLILNGRICADIRISNRHSTGAGLICRGDDLWNFLAFYTAPSADEGDFTRARISIFKQGVFSPIIASSEEVYLDEGFNQFSLEFFSGKVRGEIKTSQKIYELTYTCPHIPFPGYVGLVKLYGTGVTVKNVKIERTELPFEEKHKRKMKTFEYDVFICHSSKDKPFIIDKIIPEFQQQGITYWFDAEQITFGAPVTQKIEEGLQKSKYVMPCLSENLAQSGWTRGEYSAILNAEFSSEKPERITIPLKLDNCEDRDIPLLLRDKKRVDYSNKVEFAEFLKFLKN